MKKYDEPKLVYPYECIFGKIVRHTNVIKSANIIVPILNGSLMFLYDLLKVNPKVEVYPLIINTYKDNQVAENITADISNIEVYSKLNDVVDRSDLNILIIDDIVSTGRTLNVAINHIKKYYPNANIKTFVVIDNIDFADYKLFTGSNNYWYAGYGMDPIRFDDNIYIIAEV